MTTQITLSVVGDFVGSHRNGSFVTLDMGAEQVTLTLSFNEEGVARRFADAVDLARSGPEHSALTIVQALVEASRLAKALSVERLEGGSATWDVDRRDIAGEAFDVRLLSHHFRSAAAAAFTAVADMDAALAFISSIDVDALGGAENALSACRAAAGQSLMRSRGPKREDQLNLFGQPTGAP
ncbi:MAG: hypothetical protein EOS10_22425 [Mesorhizobium sp.]|uniref:hypothetical protein n=1 Tax=Mesorhizobium sp. TaxID=1871066 RepID=UPI000FE63EB5|nr:hypothetical protein [Mesorhizobium sp.]RWO29602.1 MAG: hypothetical protein EOS10_22425 [Mesorhizobium sp.]